MKTTDSFFTSKIGERILKNSPIVLSVIVVLMLAFGGWGQVLTTTAYSTAGTFDWVVPPCVTSVTVRVWGGGGGGSGASSSDLNGGGGGGGAYCIKTETVTPGETLRITVGAGGAGGNGANGTNGSISQVEHLAGPVVFCRAAGGARGMKSTCNSGCSGAGGSGGLIANNIPINTGFNGGNGGSSDPVVASVDRGGGGGGGAGSGSAGGNGGIVTAGLAGAPGGGAGGSGASTGTSAPGLPGIFPGGGGGGGATWNSSATGGAGARGQVTITYTATGCEPAATTFNYSTPGTFNWVVPACVNYVTVEAWGGGGGGGGNVAILKTSGASTETCTGAGGGGGGGYAARTFAVTPGQTYTIVVGAGGTGGVAGIGTTAGGISTPAGNGVVGGTSSFSGNSYNLQATGGNGGGGAGGYCTVVGSCALGNGVAGAGGNGVGGSINYIGGNGAAGLILDHSTDKSGGGGGAAGPGGNGGLAPSPGSVGTATPPGGIGDPPGGNGGNGLLYNTTGTYTGNGNGGNSIGGGGGGSLIHTGAIGVFTAIGGAGARGEVRLTYNTSCPLPIELISFTGECQDHEKTFYWSTATEHINDYFMLEHSRDGKNFEVIKTLNGTGNSTSQIDYSLSISESDDSYAYYRLGQTDFDGAFTYSDIIYVGCDDNGDQSIFFPNPFDNELNIDLSGMEERFSVAILDVNGRLIKSVDQGVLKSTNAMKIDLSELAKGIYYIELTSIETTELLKKGKVIKL